MAPPKAPPTVVALEAPGGGGRSVVAPLVVAAALELPAVRGPVLCCEGFSLVKYDIELIKLL